jgi:hypothetical protein
MCPSRVVVALGMECFGFPVEVATMLEVGHMFMKAPAFEVVLDAGELFIFPVKLGDDGMVVSFELGMAFVVALVMLDFSGDSEVH